MDASRGVLLEL